MLKAHWKFLQDIVNDDVYKSYTSSFNMLLPFLHLWSAMLQQQVNHINLHSPHVILVSIVCSSAQKQQ